MINYEQLIDDLKHETDKLPMRCSRNDELFQTLDRRTDGAQFGPGSEDQELPILR